MARISSGLGEVYDHVHQAWIELDLATHEMRKLHGEEIAGYRNIPHLLHVLLNAQREVLKSGMTLQEVLKQNQLKRGKGPWGSKVEGYQATTNWLKQFKQLAKKSRIDLDVIPYDRLYRFRNAGTSPTTAVKIIRAEQRKR